MDVWLPTHLNKIKNSVLFNSILQSKKMDIQPAQESQRVFQSPLVKSSQYGFSCQDQHFTMTTVCFSDSISFHSLLSYYHPAKLVFYVFKHDYFSLHLGLDTLAIHGPTNSNSSVTSPLPGHFWEEVLPERMIYFKSPLFYLFICLFICFFIQHSNLFAALITVRSPTPFFNVL